MREEIIRIKLKDIRDSFRKIEYEIKCSFDYTKK
jgi:hypothetical protein